MVTGFLKVIVAGVKRYPRLTRLRPGTSGMPLSMTVTMMFWVPVSAPAGTSM